MEFLVIIIRQVQFIRSQCLSPRHSSECWFECCLVFTLTYFILCYVMSVCTFLSSLVCLPIVSPTHKCVCVNKMEDIVTKMHCQFSHFKLIVQLSFWQDASSHCAFIQTKCEPAANSSHSAGDQLQLTSLISKSLCASIKPYLNLFILVAFAHFCSHLLRSRNNLKLLQPYLCGPFLLDQALLWCYTLLVNWMQQYARFVAAHRGTEVAYLNIKIASQFSGPPPKFCQLPAFYVNGNPNQLRTSWHFFLNACIGVCLRRVGLAYATYVVRLQCVTCVWDCFIKRTCYC